MIMFKACPRCRGDMHQDRDMYGEYRECLMCGFMVDIPRPGLFGAERTPPKKKVLERGSRTRTSAVRAA